jgi:hypothetical protein
MSGRKVRIELYVDPCCPFAWIAYQWLAEVRRHRAVRLGLHLMSLLMLNEHQSISLGYGSGVGTPIIHLGTAAFFGPVMTAVPRGSEALQVFDGLRLLAGYPRLFEIKRPLAGSLELGPPGRGVVPVNIATARSS